MTDTQDNADVLPVNDTKANELLLVTEPDNKTEAPAGEGKTQDSSTKDTTTKAPAVPETDKTEWEWPAEFVAAHPELAGKFKSLEDLAKSYSNLEGEFTKTRQEDKKDGKTTTAKTPEQAQKDAKEFFDRFIEDPKKALSELFIPEIRSVVGTTMALNEAWTALVGADPTLATDEKLNAEMEKMVPAVAQMIVSGTPVKDALTRAISLIRGQPTLSEKQVREQAREEARQTMLGTKGESGKTGGSPSTGQPSTDELVVSEILGASKPSLRLSSR